ncbi:type IV secretion system protein TraC [Chromobacterium haemolyticum]|uniref:type IV secretion system protein TraC n=1 Tax=Chromobacterium haemolyticum TaxID=394935 RepID=UPI001A9362B7|nr:type IV secretion system protein TraC [Chromobacterium haemolyticum]MBO0501487.1 type IV secretion system protein TraC [Chromobacterium haemolyticum]
MEQTFLEKLKAKAAQVWDEQILGNTSDVGRDPAPVVVSNDLVDGDVNHTVHTVAAGTHGLHNLVQYDQYDDKTGLFYNDTSISFCFEVIPQTGADEDMANRLNTLFTPIPPGYGVQWTLFGSPVLDEQFQAYLDQRHIAVDKGATTPFFLELAQRRIDHIKKKVGRPMFVNDNFMVKNLRLIFSVTKVGKPSDTRLVSDMVELKETLRASLRTAGLPSFSFDAEGLIRFLWPIFNPDSMFSPEPQPALRYDKTRSIRDQITKFGQHARVKSSDILIGIPPETEDEEDTRIAVRGFGVLQYPQKKELWEMANIIGSFFDDGLQYPCPFIITGGIFTLDPQIVEGKAQLKSARSKQNAKSKMAEFQPELESQKQDWDVVMHQLNQGGTMCELYHMLMLFAPKASMNKCSQVAVNIWRSERFFLAPLQSLHVIALYASLPMTLTENVRNDLLRLRVMGTKTSVNATDLSPIIGEWKGAGDPVMMFFGRRGTPTFVDFYSNQQGNYNVFVAGVSGSGKSVAMNEVVSAYRGIGARVWVIDVGRSYQNLIRLQKGTFLEFTPETKMCINPFSWVGEDDELDFKAEMRLLKPMIGRMASPNAALNEYQYSLLTEAITGVWNDYGQETNPTLIQKYLLEKIKNESGSIERVAFELGKQLQPFTEGGVYGNYFNGRANISLDADMVGLELEELKNAPELRRVVLFVLTSRIAHDMYLSRDRKKLCLVDEAWQLLGADKETAEFIEEGYRRARKYNGIFCVGTQGIEDAYKNDASQAAYNNADWKILLRQDRKNLETLIEKGLYNCSPAQKRMLLSLRTEKGRFSEMMISSPNGDSVVRHIPDPFSLLMASTNAADYNECETLLKQGYSTMEAMQIMLGRRGEDRRVRDRRKNPYTYRT